MLGRKTSLKGQRVMRGRPCEKREKLGATLIKSPTNKPISSQIRTEKKFFSKQKDLKSPLAQTDQLAFSMRAQRT